jgi:nucleoside 2-deoxyribosyltransferase
MAEKMKIYFAGSIRGGRDDKNTYLAVIKLLSHYGTILTEHVGNKDLTDSGEILNDAEIYKRDIGWLTEADFIVAEVTTPSLGVGYEIAKAEDMRKRVLCIHRPNADRKLSAMIAGAHNLTNKEYRTIEDLKSVFDEFLK